MTDKLPIKHTDKKALVDLDAAKRAMERLDKLVETAREETAAMQAREANIIIAVDATASRAAYWTASQTIQLKVFYMVEGLSGKINVQLVSYSGRTQNGSLLGGGEWHSSARDLIKTFKQVDCVAGTTQINKVFSHTLQEAEKKKVAAVFLVADSFEENVEETKKLARQLNKKGITLFVLDDAEHSTARQGNTLLAFSDIAEAAEGYYAGFSTANLNVLADYFKIAILAALGASKEEVQRSAPNTPEGKKLANRVLLRLTGPK